MVLTRDISDIMNKIELLKIAKKLESWRENILRKLESSIYFFLPV